MQEGFVIPLVWVPASQPEHRPMESSIFPDRPGTLPALTLKDLRMTIKTFGGGHKTDILTTLITDLYQAESKLTLTCMSLH